MLPVFKDIAINLELSLDGRDYFKVDGGKAKNDELFIKALHHFVQTVDTFSDNSDRLDIFSSGKLYLRLSNTDTKNFIDHIDEQKDRFGLLTRREREVLTLMFRKYAPNRITDILQIAYNTYKTHRSNIFRKLEFKSNIDMAIWCDKYLNTCLKFC
jgi:DNA-binding NarL/FixJ family response regulator